jgi:hypothetical protein
VGVFQPALGRFVSGTGGGDELPVATRVVHFAAVHKLVQDEIIADGRRGVDGAPIEGNGAAGGAGTPAGFLRADRDVPDGDAVLSRQLLGAEGQFALGHLAEMSEDGDAEIGSGGNLEGLVDEAEEGLAAKRFDMKYGGFAAEEKGRAFAPRLPRGGTGAPLFGALAQPGFAAFQKAEGFGPITAAGDDEAGGAVGLEAEQVAARAGTADEAHGEAVFPGERLIGLERRRFRRGRNEALDALFEEAEAELKHAHVQEVFGATISTRMGQGSFKYLK